MAEPHEGYSHSYKDLFGDGVTTVHSDGTSSHTTKDFFGDGVTTVHSDGSSSHSYKDFFGDGVTTYHSDGTISHTTKDFFGNGYTTTYNDGTVTQTTSGLFGDYTRTVSRGSSAPVYTPVSGTIGSAGVSGGIRSYNCGLVSWQAPWYYWHKSAFTALVWIFMLLPAVITFLMTMRHVSQTFLPNSFLMDNLRTLSLIPPGIAALIASHRVTKEGGRLLGFLYGMIPFLTAACAVFSFMRYADHRFAYVQAPITVHILIGGIQITFCVYALKTLNYYNSDLLKWIDVTALVLIYLFTLFVPPKHLPVVLFFMLAILLVIHFWLSLRYAAASEWSFPESIDPKKHMGLFALDYLIAPAVVLGFALWLAPALKVPAVGLLAAALVYLTFSRRQSYMLHVLFTQIERASLCGFWLLGLQTLFNPETYAYQGNLWQVFGVVLMGIAVVMLLMNGCSIHPCNIHQKTDSHPKTCGGAVSWLFVSGLFLTVYHLYLIMKFPWAQFLQHIPLFYILLAATAIIAVIGGIKVYKA